MLALINDIILANAATDLVDTLRAYIGPILLLIIGAVAITFLLKRQVSQFLIFIGIAIFVAILFYAPSFITAISSNFVEESDTGNWGTE
jgi:Na+/H+ antiporter NhaC